MSMFGFSKGRSQQAGRIDAIFSEEYLAKSIPRLTFITDVTIIIINCTYYHCFFWMVLILIQSKTL